MLVIKIPEGEHVTIYDKLDGAVPPIKIVLTQNGQVGIEADQRFGIVRSNAKTKTVNPYRRESEGGTDAKPISA